jgi:hypothetical protein
MLMKMVEEGLIRKRDDGRYETVGDTYDEFGRGYDKSYTVDGAVNEIDSYISYIEDLPLEKVRPFTDRIALMEERLRKLREKLH